ncbi:TPA: hypothetical protein N0F65_001927 [Lagenidium giganteum]|uniref:Uncharacterized protein n=1 Tax=Lagenidium giganteum TaxID=4803 RepID=A0AAV2YY06_9STRA|nr:TPA: hypothetical protein N0F65_001927 [Lagenidium giganteum]
MTVPQPVYEFIQAAKLTEWDQATLIKWYREWLQYVTKIEHRCALTGELYENVVATVRGCIQPDVLTIMADVVLEKPEDKVTDAEVLAAIEKRCRTVKNGFVPDQGAVRDNAPDGYVYQ